MTAAGYIQMNALPVVILTLIFRDMRKRLVLSKNNRLLSRMTMGLICLFIVDTVGWALNGVPGEFARCALWTSDMVYYSLIGLMPYQWIIYSQRRMRGDYDRHALKRMVILAVPLTAHIVLLALTPFTGAYFYIDEFNVYHRGSLLIVQQAISTGYMLLGSVMALLYGKYAESLEKKRECRFMALLMPLPLVLALLQIAFYGTSLFLPGAALVEMFVYFNILHYQVALDGMTGLNNRRSLNEYLKRKIDRQNAYEGDLYVMLIDINDFKSINDTYGHVEGDKAICLVSLNLKYCFSKTDAFISRYGGDEFAVAVNCKSETEIQAFVDRLHLPIKSWLPDSRSPIFISVGVARYDYSHATSPDKLLQEADDKMYIDKQATKKKLGGAK